MIVAFNRIDSFLARILGLFRRLRSWLFPQSQGRTTVATIKDLQATLVTDQATDKTDTDALAAATTLKQTDDDAVSAAMLAFAAAIAAAPGGSVVDATVNPPLLYQSTDGKTYTTTVIGSITDPAGGGP
jgi:hypothetical protein